MSQQKCRPLVTILIKALNEEDRIEACIRSALREANSVGGNVLLVDSLSTDRTVEIARRFSVNIVQFKNKEDCGCGAATQLGYQWSNSDYIYVLDADMEMAAGFLKRALEVLQGDESIAGVGGKLLDRKIRTVADMRRAEAANALLGDREVDELGGGGLYRSGAIDQVGYLAHRWLPAFEEAELGMRLRSRGFRLLRLSDVAVFHEGHDESNIHMLKRLWNNGRAQATGSLIRSAFGKPWFLRALRKNGYAFIIPCVYFIAIVVSSFSAGAGLHPVLSFLYVWGFFFMALLVKKRNLPYVRRTFVLWHFYAVAATIGLFREIKDPYIKIESVELQSASL